MWIKQDEHYNKDSKLGLYTFHWDVGRMGDVYGMFIATNTAVDKLIGISVDFGEILGKHSEVFGVIEKGEIVLKTDDKDFIQQLLKYIGQDISGHNPFDYQREEEEDAYIYQDGKLVKI